VTPPPDVGRAVKDALARDGHGEVIAVFSRASYVAVGDHVFALLSTAESRGPLHARVQDPPTVRLGDRVVVLAGRLSIGGGLVDLPRLCWEPAPLPSGAPIARMLGDVLLHEPALDLRSGSDNSIETSLERALDRGGLREACRWLFGRGAGLTPSGDDVAAGLLMADALLGQSDEATRLAIVADAPTHAISRAFLAWAARGQSIEPLHRLLAACARQDLRAARSARGDLAAIGHTSGLDLAYGALMGFKRAADVAAAARPALRMTSRALAQITA
jgi:Protein of unknown function (DUF2877)